LARKHWAIFCQTKKIEVKTDFQLAEFARKVKGGDNNTSNLVLIPFEKIFER